MFGDTNPACREEVKKKIGDANRRRICSEQTRERISKSRTGKPGAIWTKKMKENASVRMKENNPMKDEEIKNKSHESLMKTLNDPNFVHPNKGRLRPDLLGKPSKMSEEAKDIASARMKEDNPMKVLEIRNRMIESYKRTCALDGYVHPNKGRERLDAKNRMLSNNNPMKDPETARLVWAKAKETIKKNGGISEGQRKLYEYLDSMGFKYEPECFFQLGQLDFSYILADAYLPDFKIIIEYDGYSDHYSEEGIKRDRKRDDYVDKLFQISVIRIDTNSIFAKDVDKTILKAIDELKTVSSPKTIYIGKIREILINAN